MRRAQRRHTAPDPRCRRRSTRSGPRASANRARSGRPKPCRTPWSTPSATSVCATSTCRCHPARSGRRAPSGISGFLIFRSRRTTTAVCDVSDPEQVVSLFADVGDIVACQQRRPARRPPPVRRDRSRRVGPHVRRQRARLVPVRAAAAAAMGERGGSIVNIASETAFTGSRGFVHYVASKGAVISMTRALANELAGAACGSTAWHRASPRRRVRRCSTRTTDAHPARPGDASRRPPRIVSTCCPTTRRSSPARRSLSTAVASRTRPADLGTFFSRLSEISAPR